MADAGVREPVPTVLSKSGSRASIGVASAKGSKTSLGGHSELQLSSFRNAASLQDPGMVLPNAGSSISLGSAAGTEEGGLSLRVYGGEAVVAPGVLYKSVLVSPSMTAQEVIKRTLERYGETNDSTLYDLVYARVVQQKKKNFFGMRRSSRSKSEDHILRPDEAPVLVTETYPDESRRFELRMHKASKKGKKENGSISSQTSPTETPIKSPQTVSPPPSLVPLTSQNASQRGSGHLEVDADAVFLGGHSGGTSPTSGLGASNNAASSHNSSAASIHVIDAAPLNGIGAAIEEVQLESPPDSLQASTNQSRTIHLNVAGSSETDDLDAESSVFVTDLDASAIRVSNLDAVASVVLQSGLHDESCTDDLDPIEEQNETLQETSTRQVALSAVPESVEASVLSSASPDQAHMTATATATAATTTATEEVSSVVAEEVSPFMVDFAKAVQSAVQNDNSFAVDTAEDAQEMTGDNTQSVVAPATTTTAAAAATSPKPLNESLSEVGVEACAEEATEALNATTVERLAVAAQVAPPTLNVLDATLDAQATAAVNDSALEVSHVSAANATEEPLLAELSNLSTAVVAAVTAASVSESSEIVLESVAETTAVAEVQVAVSTSADTAAITEQDAKKEELLTEAVIAAEEIQEVAASQAEEAPASTGPVVAEVVAEASSQPIAAESSNSAQTAQETAAAPENAVSDDAVQQSAVTVEQALQDAPQQQEVLKQAEPEPQAVFVSPVQETEVAKESAVTSDAASAPMATPATAFEATSSEQNSPPSTQAALTASATKAIFRRPLPLPRARIPEPSIPATAAPLSAAKGVAAVTPSASAPAMITNNATATAAAAAAAAAVAVAAPANALAVAPNPEPTQDEPTSAAPVVTGIKCVDESLDRLSRQQSSETVPPSPSASADVSAGLVLGRRMRNLANKVLSDPEADAGSTEAKTLVVSETVVPDTNDRGLRTTVRSYDVIGVKGSASVPAAPSVVTPADMGLRSTGVDYRDLDKRRSVAPVTAPRPAITGLRQTGVNLNELGRTPAPSSRSVAPVPTPADLGLRSTGVALTDLGRSASSTQPSRTSAAPAAVLAGLRSTGVDLQTLEQRKSTSPPTSPKIERQLRATGTSVQDLDRPASSRSTGSTLASPKAFDVKLRPAGTSTAGSKRLSMIEAEAAAVASGVRPTQARAMVETGLRPTVPKATAAATTDKPSDGPRVPRPEKLSFQDRKKLFQVKETD